MTSDTKDPVDNVVRIRPDVFPLRAGDSTGNKAPACFHHQAIIDQRMRIVQCGTCGANIDAIDELLKIARESDWVLAMRAEARQLREQITALKAEATTHRATVRRVRQRANESPVTNEAELETLWYRLLCALAAARKQRPAKMEKISAAERAILQAGAKALFDLGAFSGRVRMEEGR
ncbi:MAG: hypothetical protein ACHREM_02360 [Polyangiales bacterium]